MIRRGEPEHEQTGIVSASVQRFWFGDGHNDEGRESDWWDWWVDHGQHLVNRDGGS